jgi:hypothetical protein
MIRMHFTRLLAVAAIVAVSVSCGSTSGIGGGRGSSFLVIDSLQGIRGATTLSAATTTLTSDVITNVISPAPCSSASPCPTVFGDPGVVVMRVVMKDVASANPTTPSAINDITLTRYHVEYTRADGHNTPGVDVPFPFDGVLTATVTGSATSVGFSLVRVQAKEEAPLVLLKFSGAIVSQFAKVTFYGADQAGNQVSIAGSIGINFGNFGDL